MAGARGISVMALLAALPFSQLSAEITLDGTMGPAGPLAGPVFTIPDTLGTTQGANLFHSFSVFNIASTESATFTGPASLDNVISRVTGGTPSSIDGLFRSTVPGADVYFINPAGVIFGQNASLDVQGAFYTTTADELRFADGNVFSASNPLATVLTAAAPAAFGFLGANPAGITVNYSTLEVPTGERLALVGGDITIEGSSDGLRSELLNGMPGDPIVIGAAGGRIDLVSVASPGEVGLNGADADGFARYGNISIKDAVVSVSADTSGEIYIRGGQVMVDSASVLSDTVSGDGGDITFEADSVLVRRDEIRIVSGEPRPSIRASTSGVGKGGDVWIEAGSLTVDRGISIETDTVGPGPGGDMRVDVGRLELRDTGFIQTNTDGPGRGGDFTLSADSVFIVHRVASGRDAGTWTLTGFRDPDSTGNAGDTLATVGTVEVESNDAYFASSFTGGRGRGGNVVVNAESLVFRDGGRLVNNSEGTTGDSGNIDLRVGRLEVRSGSRIVSGAFGTEGDAGDIHIEADSVLISADGNFDNGLTSIFSTTFFSDGDAGNVDINARSLEILPGGTIFSSSLSSARGGNTTIAVDSLLIDGGGTIYPRTLRPPTGPRDCACLVLESTHISASSAFGFSGPPGNIDITAATVTVRGGAAIEAITASGNPGGNVTVTANAILVETDGRLDSGSVGPGAGGDINLSAQQLTLASGGNIIASSTGSGLAGDINISVADSFQSNGGFVSTEAIASDGGNVTINAVTMLDLLNSSVTTSVQGGAGAGGNINIDPQFVIVQNSSIIANAFGGPGGNINITAGLFLIDPSSVISASSALGLNGIINVDSPVADVTSGVTELPADELDASTLVQAPCAAQAAGTSSLTSAGRSGLPAGPDGYLPSPGFGLATHSTAAADATHIPVSVRDASDGGQALQLAMAGLGCS